ncbi:plant basic secretory protein [Irpex rosettiformis]|uniref:Plant basic secretory protein n=1 Tax=Irpex rosettiformis TaxID=378272 RepID=A0ACB8ULB8_9APHY|nr:plant basic secretory protein [Irpex rosettiformis]
MPPLPRPPPCDPNADWPIPKLTIRCDDLAHPGAQLFFQHINPCEALREAVLAVYCWLYTPQTVPRNVEKILLVLRPMDGVAHTFGSDIYKEIHFSLDHIRNSSARAKDEIHGVIVHEMVHCFQHDGAKHGGHCPGGLVEGVADWVRLRAGYAPPHWREGYGGTWDAGYEATGYFLDWLEERYGYGVVKELNDILGKRAYGEEVFRDLTGRKVKKLWKLYRDYVDEGSPSGSGGPALPTEGVSRLSLDY